MNAPRSPDPERVQAWVDGELPETEARELARQLEQDPTSRALAENLRDFSRLLREHEPVHPLAESRDFYWSKIRRGIEAQEAAAARAETTTPVRVSRRRWFLPWALPAGAALLAAALYLGGPGSHPSGRQTHAKANEPVMTDHEVESPSEEMTTVTFYSAQDGMTVVWLGRVDLI